MNLKEKKKKMLNYRKIIILKTVKKPVDSIVELNNLRCLNCGKLLAKYLGLMNGKLEIKCKCKQLNEYDFK